MLIFLSERLLKTRVNFPLAKDHSNATEKGQSPGKRQRVNTKVLLFVSKIQNSGSEIQILTQQKSIQEKDFGLNF
jgi:hypothetical protein